MTAPSTRSRTKGLRKGKATPDQRTRRCSVRTCPIVRRRTRSGRYRRGENGTGNGTKGHGLDREAPKYRPDTSGALGNVVTNKFNPSPFDFVDGVFIADGKGGSAKIPVSSTGLTVTGLPKTSGKAWDMIRNGPVASQHSTKLDGIDFKDTNQSLLGIHANAGITFSLDAFRKALGQADLRFTAQVGYFGAGGNHRASAWVVIDGKIEESS